MQAVSENLLALNESFSWYFAYAKFGRVYLRTQFDEDNLRTEAA